MNNRETEKPLLLLEINPINHVQIKFSRLFFLFVSHGLLSATTAAPEVLFYENFEADDALDKWVIESTNQRRVQIAPDPRDPGNRGLLMDDAVNDVIFSQNIARASVSIAGYSHISNGNCLWYSCSYPDRDTDSSLLAGNLTEEFYRIRAEGK